MFRKQTAPPARVSHGQACNIRAEIRALFRTRRQAMKWRSDMEAAPQDGTPIFVCWKRGRDDFEYDISIQDGPGNWWHQWFEYRHDAPDYWALPLPPQGEG